MKRGKIIVGIFLAVSLFVILSINVIRADGLTPELINVSSPIRWGNYSTFINLSLRTNYQITGSGVGAANSYNATLYCNKTGGTVGKIGVDVIKIVTLQNSSPTAMVLSNATVRIDSIILGANNTFNYNCSVYVDNYTNYNWSVSAMWNITFDSLPPAVSFSGITDTINNGNYTGTIVLNVSVIKTYSRQDANISSVWFNITYSNGTQVNFTRAIVGTAAGNNYNLSIDTTMFIDGGYNITVYANDTALTKPTFTQGYANGTNLNNSASIYIVLDRTAPTGSYSCSPESVSAGDTVTCSCSPSDATSGINSSATGSTTNPSTGDTGTHTLTCSFADMVGLTGSASTTYTVELIFSSGGATGITATSNQKVSSFTQITPGAAAIIKNFNADTGLKEIQINVNNNAQNVKVTVTKYDTKPAEVSVEKIGKVYKYIQVNASNLADKLSNAKFTIKVNKSWVSSNSLTKDNVALFRFDSTAGKWNELTTTYASEDDTYYYYDATTPGFSYFAIGEKTVTGQPSTQQPSGQQPSGEVPSVAEWSWNNWMWISLGVIAAVAAAVVLFLMKKKRR